MNSRKIILILVLLKFSASNSFAQKVIDSIKICDYPVREGVVYRYDQRNTFWGCLGSREQGTSIFTHYDSVFHIGVGKVVAVHYYGHDADGGYAIIIKGQSDEFVSYSNLKSVFLHNGDTVRKGMFLGLAGKSEDSSCKQVDFMFLKKGKQLPFGKEVEYIRCDISCKQEDGYTL